MSDNKNAAQLKSAQQKIALQYEKREKKAYEHIIDSIERDLELVEKVKRAAGIIPPTVERGFRTQARLEKASKLAIANLKRIFQHDEAETLELELLIVNSEPDIQGTERKTDTAELVNANKKLALQSRENEKIAAELMVANNELLLQNKEKEERAAELLIANEELKFQNTENGKRASELLIANEQLAIQNLEKENRVTELFMANKKLALQDRESEINKRKDEFIGIASHELKTPLTSIDGYLQVLKRTLTLDTNKQFVDKALRQVGKLSGLISDLLDVSKIEAGKLTLHYETFDMFELAKEVTEIVQFGVHTHKIDCSCMDRGLLVTADKQRIEQVMINLMSNAIKYSPKASSILVSVSQTDADVIVSVQDFGLGIKEEEQKNIFTRFYRVEGLASHIAGLGIGLFISEDIISRHKGLISLMSKTGEGSTFTFTIPKNR